MSSSAAPGIRLGPPVLLLATVLLLPYLAVLYLHWSRSGSSHGIPSLLSLLIGVWIGGRKIRQPGFRDLAGGSPVLGLLGLALAVTLYLAGVCLYEKRAVAGFGATLIPVALVYLWRGVAGLRFLWLPISLLLFAVPLPGVILDRLTYSLVDMASVAAATVLSWMFASVDMQGSVITIGSHRPIEVVEECSGLRGTLLFVPLALGLLYLFPRISWRGGAILLLLALPLALFANLLRVLGTALLVVSGSSLQDSESFHEGLGVASLALGMVLLYGLASRLGREPSKKEAAA